MTVYQYDLLLNENNIPQLKVVNEFFFNKNRFFTPAQIKKFMNTNFYMCSKAEEYVYLLCLNNTLAPAGIFELSHGGVDKSIVGIREIMIRALVYGATGIVLVHNHPGGTVSPSKDDLKIENAIKKACEFMQIAFIDSIIIGKNKYRSMAEGK